MKKLPHKQRRFLKTKEEIASALGIPCSKEFARELDEFKRWDDWPREQKQGFLRDDVIGFYTKNASKIAAQRKLAQVVDPLAASKITSADLKLLLDGGVGNESQEPEEDLPNVNTQVALAGGLQKHFGNRIAIVIDAEAVSSWRRGERLPDQNAPLPPQKRGNYWSVREWAGWVEKWILPHHLPKSGTFEAIPLARLQAERVKAELEEIEHARMMREVEAGKYIEVQRAENIRRGGLILMRNMHRRLRETENTEARAAWLMTKLNPHDLAAFKEYDMSLEIESHDRFERELQKLSEEDGTVD